MSIESFLRRPDIPDIILERNKDDRTHKRAFSPYHSLALKLKEEGTDGLRRRRLSQDRLTDRDLNYGAIIFGIAMRAIEIALKEGIFDSNETLSLYNEAVTGARHYNRIDGAYAEPQQIPEIQLQAMRRYSAKDRTHAIFFINEDAYRSLPQSLRTLIEYTKSLDKIKKIIPLYTAMASLLPPPSPTIIRKVPELAARVFDLPELSPSPEQVDRIITDFAKQLPDFKE